MKQFTIEVASGDLPAVKVEKEFPENLDEAIQEWGAEVVYNLAVRMAKTDLQNRLRAQYRKGTAAEELIANASEWKPGVTQPKAQSIDSMLKKFAKLSPEKQNEVLEALLAKAKEQGEI